VGAAQEIYTELIAPVEQRMMHTVARIAHDPDDAAEAFQNAATFIWKNLKKIHHHPNPHAYILSVCASAAYDILRQKKRWERQTSLTDSSKLPASSSSGPECASMAAERERILLKAIATLPRNQAQAVLLRVMEDESFENIAEALNCGTATARSHVSKGKARLRDILTQHRLLAEGERS
jgi:RNA polymerase sigma factor (sigma-70 family)